MNLPPLNVDNDIEKLIKKAQQSFGTISSSDLGDSDMISGIYLDWMREKMVQYKLIEKTGKGSTYALTERGWQFESFAKEDAIAELNRKKLKIDVQNAERINTTYWWTFSFAVGAFAISLVLLVLKIKELAG